MKQGSKLPDFRKKDTIREKLHTANNVIKQLEHDKLILTTALSEVVAWDSLSLETRVDIGSNGQRDYYRDMAELALNKVNK